MNRITKKFEELKKAGKKALISYVAAGDPSMEMTVPILQQLVKSGVDILEVGMIFSDPVAEGPVIQAAHLRALNAGMTLHKVFDIVAEFRKTDKDTPIVLMGYINPIETMGYENFVKQLKQTEVDGVLIVDLPPEEGTVLTDALKKQDIAPIFLIAPTTTEERAKYITGQCRGFQYVVSFKGVTGSGVIDFAEIEKQVQQIKQYVTLPIAIGFGIRDGKTAAAMAKFAEAIVVGSAYVSIIEQYGDNKTLLLSKLADFTQELRAAIDGNGW